MYKVNFRLFCKVYMKQMSSHLDLDSIPKIHDYVYVCILHTCICTCYTVFKIWNWKFLWCRVFWLKYTGFSLLWREKDHEFNMRSEGGGSAGAFLSGLPTVAVTSLGSGTWMEQKSEPGFASAGQQGLDVVPKPYAPRTFLCPAWEQGPGIYFYTKALWKVWVLGSPWNLSETKVNCPTQIWGIRGVG